MDSYIKNSQSPGLKSNEAEKRAFLTDGNKSDSPRNRYLMLHDQIMFQLEHLDQNIDNILQRHENDFLNAFKYQMYQLYTQIRDLKAQDQNKSEIPEDQQFERLNKSLEWFRNEAIRLGESTQHFRKECDKWKAKAKSLEEDRNFLEQQLKISKRQLKQYKQAKDENAAILEEAQQEQVYPFQINFEPTSQQGEYILDIMQQNQSNILNAFKGIEKLMCKQNEKYLATLAHYKSMLDMEKKKIRSINSQRANYIYEKSDIEKLFLDCVQDVRKQLSRRVTQPRFANPRSASSTRAFRQQHVSSQEKLRILELFLGKEEVLMALYEKMFPHRASNYPINNLDESQILPEVSSLLQKIPNNQIIKANVSKPQPPMSNKPLRYSAKNRVALNTTK